MTTRTLSEEELVDRFGFWTGLFGFKIERHSSIPPDESIPPEECSYTYFDCYNEDTDTMVYVGVDLEDFARTMKVLKPWEQLAKQETDVITGTETDSLI